jgi:hypothetical protein
MTQAKERDRLGEGKQCGEPLATGVVAPCLASGRYASCDAAALALVRHLVLEHSKAALAELCDTTSLHRLCISSLKFDRSNFAGRSTGRSADFSSCGVLPTSVAARRYASGGLGLCEV